jgi:hypothetical protein
MTTAKPSAGDDPMVQALHAGISRRNWDDVGGSKARHD